MRRWPLLLSFLLLGGCADVLAGLVGGTTVSGTVKAPSTQQAGIFFGGAYRISATLPGETALSGATVRAVGTSGVAYGSSVTTTSSGTYELRNLPTGAALVVEATATGKSGTLHLSGLIKSTGTTEVRDVNASSTVVAEKLRGALNDAAFSRMTQSDVDRLESLVAANLDTSLNGLDLTQPTTAVQVFDALQQKVSAIRDAYASLTGSTATTAAL